MTNPDIKEQDAPSIATHQDSQEEARKLVSAHDIASEWWVLFKSPQLSEHINRVFKANPDTEAAQAILRKSQEHPVIRQGYFFPRVGAPLRDTQEQPTTVKFYYNLHTSQLTVGYVPEMLVANRELAASQSQGEAQQEAAFFTLSSNVVAAAIQEAALRAQIEAQLNIIGLNRQSLEIVHNQFKLGYVSEDEVTLRELDAARTQQTLAPLQQQLEQTRDLMRILAGNLTDPDGDTEDAFALDELRLSRELPFSLPSTLVLQRPDVRVAEAQLRSVGEQNGVEVVNTMPRFTITGAAVSSPTWMLRDGGKFFELNGNMAQYIFSVKTMRTKSHVAQQALNRAATQYRTVVMVALQNVADTLNVIQSDARTLDAVAEAAKSEGKKAEQTLKSYEAGSVDFPTLRLAEQNEQLANINLLQARANQLGDGVALFQALGGRWWKREETTDKTAAK